LEFLKVGGLRILSENSIFGGAADILPAVTIHFCLQMDAVKFSITQEHHIRVFWHNFFDLLDKSDMVFF
jgi:hypothetical protein